VRSRACSAEDTGQTGSTNRSDRYNYDETTKNAQTKESRSGQMEGGQGKGKMEIFKHNFDYLVSKYVNQKAVSKNRSSKGIATPSPKLDRSRSYLFGQTSNVIKIGSMDVIIDDQVNQKTLDHEISHKSSTSKHVQWKWCPPGLSHTQKRRLRRLQSQKSKYEELKLWNEVNNKEVLPARPPLIGRKEWRPMQVTLASK
jgi:hypothetical protein